MTIQILRTLVIAGVTASVALGPIGANAQVAIGDLKSSQLGVTIARVGDLTAEIARAEAAEASALKKSNNLSDLPSPSTALSNLGAFPAASAGPLATQAGASPAAAVTGALGFTPPQIGTTTGTAYDGGLGAADHALAVAAVPGSHVGVPNGVAATDANGRVPLGQSYPADSYRFIGANNFIGGIQGNYSPGSGAYGETTRVVYTATQPITHLKLFLPAQSASNGLEINQPNPVFYSASVEYPLSGTSTPPMFTLGGQTQMEVGTQGSGTFTDPLGLYIPAGAQFAIRYGTYVARPPTISATAVGTGGSLPSSTTYYYKATAVVDGVESGPSAEVSVATTGTNQAITLTLTAPFDAFLPYTTYKIYRGTASGNEGYLGSVTVPGTTYVDNGTVPATISVPPYSTYHYYTLNDSLESGMSSDSVYAGGLQAFNVIGTGPLAEVGPSTALVSRPYVLADMIGGFSVIGLGDSIEAGYSISQYSFALGFTPLLSSWFGQAMVGNNIDFLNESLPSATISGLMSQGLYGSSTRWNLSRYGKYVLSNLGTNDIYSGASTGVQVASWQIQVAQALWQRGQRYYVTTLLPRVQTTDHVLTLANQLIYNTTYESYRVWYNTWIRNGFQVLAGVPVLTGGTPCPYIAGFFDIAQALGEVNSAGVPTLNGGYWPVPTSAAYTGQILTGTPTTTSLPIGAASYGVHALAGYVIKMTSGAASGQTAVVSDNTATGLSVTGLTTAPAAGDTASIWGTIGSEGIHPTDIGHNNIALGQNGNIGSIAWVAANFTGF